MFKIVNKLLKFRTKPINVYQVARMGCVVPSPVPNFEAFTHYKLQKRFFSDEVAKAQRAAEFKGEVTIFDKIISKEINADIIYEDDKCLAFNDVAPQAPVHFLVIPKKKLEMLDSCTGGDADIISHLMLTAKNLAKKKLPEGYRLVINNGKHGAQSVFHLHIHILGGRQMKWPPG